MADLSAGPPNPGENVSPDFQLLARHTEHIVDQVLTRRGFCGGGDSPSNGDIERRLKAVEASHAEIMGTLAELLERMYSIRQQTHPYAI